MDPQVPLQLHIATFEEIMAAEDIVTVDVPVPEWPGLAVQIRTLSAAGMLRYVADSRVGDGKGGDKLDNTLAMQNLIVESLVAPALTFPQVQALWQKSWPAIHGIQTAILKLNKMDEASKEEVAAAFPAQPDAGAAV